MTHPNLTPVENSKFSSCYGDVSAYQLESYMWRAEKGEFDSATRAAIRAEARGRIAHYEETHQSVKDVVSAELAEFRIEVVAELVALGFAPHVAANLTNTEQKLMAKAKEIGYI